MYKNYFYTIIIYLSNVTLFAQNLIPNPSFEEYNCFIFSDAECVSNWYAPSGNPD